MVRKTHTHEEIRIKIVRSGNMKVTNDDHEMELGPGDFVSTLPNAPHCLEALGEESLRLIEFVFPSE